MKTGIYREEIQPLFTRSKRVPSSEYIVSQITGKSSIFYKKYKFNLVGEPRQVFSAVGKPRQVFSALLQLKIIKLPRCCSRAPAFFDLCKSSFIIIYKKIPRGSGGKSLRCQFIVMRVPNMSALSLSFVSLPTAQTQP